VEESAVYVARALVLRDLQTTRVADAEVVSLLEEAVTTRRWWVEQWPEGVTYVAGLVAQDIQDALLERVGRWPLCSACEDSEPHAIYIYPELGGPDPVWVCEASGATVAALGSLP
jgi:hypothetical protein